MTIKGSLYWAPPC